MESQTIAALIKYFNIASAAVLAFFAVFGVIAAIMRKSRLSIFGGSAFLTAFCVAALAAFVLEATVFNFPRYLKFFAGPELQTEDISPENPHALRISNGTLAEIVSKQDGDVGILFKNLDMNVTSVFVDLDFNDTELGEIYIEWTDEESTRGFSKKLYKRLPYENYTPVQPSGKVSELKVVFRAGGNIQVRQIALNKAIPLYFSGLRLLVVSFLFFAVLSLLKKELRVKLAYLFFEYKFDPANKKQNLIYALFVILLVLFVWLCGATSFTKIRWNAPAYSLYNKYLVDAIIEGRANIDYGTPEKLLSAERPYDPSYRDANGYVNPHDWTWYKGKYYCYFGVVPAVILYVPYKMITGNYLSTPAGIILFTSVTVLLLALLWRHCVKKYMPDSRFAFYILSFLALFFASSLYAPLRLMRYYSIVSIGGVMFAVAGTLLLLKSVEKERINRLKLFFACFCFALVVGCRPNMIFVSLLVPVILWKYRSWKLLLFISIPYVIVAIPLCMYNYARFGSIFEFGTSYMLTSQNIQACSLINPIGKIVQMFECLMYYLFYPNKYMLEFPFVETTMSSASPSPHIIIRGAYFYHERGSAMINYPIVFCLFYYFVMLKNTLKQKQLAITSVITAFLIVAAVMLTANSIVVAFFSGRYVADLAIYIILPSLFCAYCFVMGGSGGVGVIKIRFNVVYAMLVTSIFIGLCLFVNSTDYAHNNPVLYRYLEYSLGILRSV